MTDPTRPETGSIHVYRGGGWVSWRIWFEDALRCRSAHRAGYYPGIRYDSLGSRVALVAVP